MILYPRLEKCEDLIARAVELGKSSVETCRKRRRNTDTAAVYSATGGARATTQDLERAASALTEIAIKHGYPEEKGRNTDADAEWAAWLHANLDTSGHEASQDSMWHFFTVDLVPDLVRWRWGATKDDTTSDRWVTVKHRGRNAFGRLWWRGEVFRDEENEDPYWIVKSLGEDELVQIMERPSFAGNRLLSRTTAAAILGLNTAKLGIKRGDILRDHQKRMLRLGAFTDFQSLDAQSTSDLVQEVLGRTLSAMTGTTQQAQLGA